MSRSFKSAALLFALVAAFVLAAIAAPAAPAQAQAAKKQITITITEAQLNKYLPTVRPRGVKKIEADIIDGGIIIKLTTNFTDIPEYHEHYGVLIRDGKIVTEGGVFDIPGIGSLGYADVKALIPDLAKIMDSNGRVINKFVLRQVTAKAGTRYTVDSVTTGNDQIVIVVTK